MQYLINNNKNSAAAATTTATSTTTSPATSAGNLIVFNASKNEIFQVTDNYKTLYRRLKSNFKVDT